MLSRLRELFEYRSDKEYLPTEQSLAEVQWILEYIVQHHSDTLLGHSCFRFAQKLLELSYQLEELRVKKKRDRHILTLQVFGELKGLVGNTRLDTVVEPEKSLPVHTRGIFYLDSAHQTLSQLDIVLIDPHRETDIFSTLNSIPQPRPTEWVSGADIILPYHEGEKLHLFFAAQSSFDKAPRPVLPKTGPLAPFPVR